MLPLSVPLRASAKLLAVGGKDTANMLCSEDSTLFQYSVVGNKDMAH